VASGRPAFRPDIEGLRGVAILLVVLFHAGVPALAGGFVGVDVFFVLSGFFITGLLVREMEDTGTVDVNGFWGKRSLRLLPALLLVLGATLAGVMLLYTPIDRAAIAGAARSVALYSGNMEFAQAHVNYFNSGENPLLHTWSLAVEEQFYFVWPLLVLLGAWALSRRSAEEREVDAAGRKWMLIGIAVVGAISFGASIWVTQSAQMWAFFAMPTRIWEFALGGATALMLGESSETSDRAPTIIQVAGLVAVGLAVVLYDQSTPYPGIAAALPAVGAVGLIAGGHRAPGSFVTRALSVEPLQFFGRLSYAWYLWHWPLVGLAAVLNPDIGVWGKLAWTGAALGLAWLTYWFVEQPARNGGRLSRIPGEWLGPVALGASIAAAGVSHVAMSLAQRSVSRGPQKVFAAAREDRVYDNCWTNSLDEFTEPCVIGDPNSSTVLALLGDSHAQHWTAGLDRAGKEHGWKILVTVKGGCPVADMPEVMNGYRSKQWYAECARFREAMVQRIIAAKPSAVILSNWDHYVVAKGSYSGWQVTPDVWRDGLRRTYSRFTSAGIKTIVIRGTPRTYFDVPGCLSRKEARLPGARSCTYERSKAFSPAAVRAQTDAARGLPIRFVDMNSEICATATCATMQSGIVQFTDDNHLAATFSRSLGPVLGAEISSALHGRFVQPSVVRSLAELVAASTLR
jgi:peptidoglycan/LPS O-acetylase OafA/YrhL